MTKPDPMCRVRLTDDAISDIHRLHKKDPRILKEIFKKMLLLERGTHAGEPLLGTLAGFRKLKVGNRDYRIVWRETTDEDHRPTLEIAEVWAAGARADSEVYAEMRERIGMLAEQNSPHARALAEVIEEMGRLYDDIKAHPEPPLASRLPAWLVTALHETLHLSPEEISALSQHEAQRLLTEHWSRPSDL